MTTEPVTDQPAPPRGEVAAHLRHDRPELAEVGHTALIALAVMSA